MLLPIKDYNPTKRTAYITIILICINAALFLYQSVLSDKPLVYHVATSAMVPYEVSHFKNTNVPLGRDRFGRVVATNEPELQLLLRPDQVGDLDATLDRIGRIVVHFCPVLRVEASL